MRDRIRRACFYRLKRADAATGDYWLTILRSIEQARVQTIHSYCGALVRSHAIELGIDPMFQVLDGPASQVMRSEAVDAALRGRLDCRDQVVMNLAKEYDLPGLKSRIAGLLSQAATPEFHAWLEREPQDAVEAWREAYHRWYVPHFASAVAEAPSVAELLELLPLATPSGPDYADVRDELSERLMRIMADEATADDLVGLRPLTMIKGVCKQADWPDKELFTRYKAACTALRKMADELKPLAERQTAIEAAKLGLDLLHVTAEVDETYRDAKESAGVLDYDDLLQEARRLLTAPEFADIQRRLQSRVQLLLVDEFQDTDRGQVAIVKALVGPGFDEGRLFFVGDYKQSIYRFRGAEPDVFEELRSEIPKGGQLPLAKNFRSQPGVIDFVNALFRPVFGEKYQPLRAARRHVTAKPAVEFYWTPVADDANAAAQRQAEARSIAARLRTLIDEQAPVVVGKDDRPRPVRPKDIAILFRALSDVAYYEQALRDEGLEYYLVGGHAFYSQQEVYDVANLLRSIASTCDEIALAGVLRSPFFSLQDETLFWLTRMSGSSLSAGFASESIPPELTPQEADKLAFARRTLLSLRRQKGRASVAEILCHAIAQTSYDAILLSEFLGERKLANLNKLIDQARAFDAYRPGDLDGFVRQLSEFIAREPKEALAANRVEATDDEAPGEVQLMSVHMSKGLEFPVVVAADLNRKAQGNTDSVAFSPTMGPLVHPPERDNNVAYGLDIYRRMDNQADQGERDRVFYVACTRAADYLILSASYSLDGKLEGPFMETLDEWFDLSSGALRSAPDGEALVRVVAPDSSSSRGQGGGKGVNRLKMLEGVVAQAASADLPPTAQPVPIEGEAIQRFSVSRLTGQLHHATTRPVAQDVTAALTSESVEIDPRGLGTLVHDLLERISFVGPNSLREWSIALAPLHVHRHIEQAAEAAEQMVAKFMGGERFATLTQAVDIDREVEFLLPWPSAGGYLQGYIDCLMQDASGEWTVLDYKTNRVDAAGVSELAEQYRFQLYVYAMAVEQAKGKSPSELCIHFLRPGVEITFPWDDAARVEARRMVSGAIAGVRTEAVSLG